MDTGEWPSLLGQSKESSILLLLRLTSKNWSCGRNIFLWSNHLLLGLIGGGTIFCDSHLGSIFDGTLSPLPFDGCVFCGSICHCYLYSFLSKGTVLKELFGGRTSGGHRPESTEKYTFMNYVNLKSCSILTETSHIVHIRYNHL